MIPLKACQDIDKMSQAGKILSEIMEELAVLIKPGILTKSLDEEAARLIARFKVRSAFKGYRGYPANICVSVNEVVVHGIPGERKLAAGDIVSIDIGIERDGFFADMAKTFPVGKIDSKLIELIRATEASLEHGVAAMKPGGRLSDVSNAVQEYVEASGFSVVRDFVGHGIGRELHEEPQIPNFGTAGNGPILRDGMVFAIEPMVNLGDWRVEILQDGWTAVTKDRLPSAHHEHTVAIWNGKATILT